MPREDTVASVIVPTHHGAHRLPALLDALAAQTIEEPWEVVVVVDGVLDETLQLLECYETRLSLRPVVQHEAVGVCRGLNAGYAAARGWVLIRCDDDLTPAPDMVARHVAWHRRPGRRGVVGATRDIFPATPYAIAYGSDANERSLAATYVRPAEQLWINWAAHNSVTREAWDLVGGFDPRFVYGQDSELGWRLREAGVSIVVDPGLELVHRGPTTTAANRVPRAFVAGASRRLFAEVHPDARPEPRPPRGLRDRTWEAGVSALATLVQSRAACQRIGLGLDRVLRLVPVSIGRRLVAFAVEAAGRSGERHGPRDLREFASQKRRELRAELPQAP
jgi:GT2 family glycosyltransferase